MIRKISNTPIRTFGASASLVILSYFYAIGFFPMITVFVIFDIWEISIAAIVTLVSLFAIALWKLLYRLFSKVLRGFIFAIFALCFGVTIFGLLGSLGVPGKVPLYSTLGAVIFGLSVEMAIVFSTYDMFKRASFSARAGSVSTPLQPREIETKPTIRRVSQICASKWFTANRFKHAQEHG
jgi:hypothetical protein